MTALVKGKVKQPGPGDCWYCLMKLPGADHIESHINENYFVPSLLANACERFPVSIAARGWIASMMDGKKDPWESLGGICDKQVRKALIRYLKEKLGYPA